MTTTTSLKLEGAPHDASVTSTGKIMRIVMYALIPALIGEIYFYGFGIVINMIIALVTALVTEGIILKLRNHCINRLWRDSSAALTAVLLAFTLPPLVPWYLTMIGTFFAIAIVKHTFGGLGQNIFNPAMGGFIFLLVSAPLPMTEYVSAVPNNFMYLTPIKSVQIIFNVNKGQALKDAKINAYYVLLENRELSAKGLMKNIDNLTGPTFLIDAKHEQPNHNVDKFTQENMGNISNYDLFAKVVLSSLFLLGGVILLITKVIDYRIPLSFFATFVMMSGIFYAIDPTKFLPIFYHLIFGATIFGGFFILTDPVTAVSKPIGAIIYGAVAAIFLIIIRNLGGYPDAIAFSVLLTNACAPLITIMTKRKAFGANSKPGDLYNEQ